MTIALQRCAACGAYQYPDRDLCRTCLADALHVEEVSGEGRLIAEALVHRSLDPGWAARLPVRIGTIALRGEIRLIAFLDDDAVVGREVVVRAVPDADGRRLFVAGSGTER